MKLIIALAVLTLPAAAQVVNWKIDAAHSAANFSVRHMMVSTVRGSFGRVNGTVQFDPKNPSSAVVEATIDVNMIDTREPKRDAHLKSADFFDVEKFPTMTFKSKSVRAVAPGKLRMTGDLTIHGVTREVNWDVEGPTAELNTGRTVKSGASATTKISRKEFGMTWNRAIEAGGVAVSDEVSITVDIELDKQPAP